MDQEKTRRLLCAVRDALGEDAKDLSATGDEVSVQVPRARLVATLLRLRDDPDVMMNQLVDLCGVDYPDRAERFEVVYHLSSLKHLWRVRVRTTTDGDATVPSVTELWPAAGWFEREAWDMFGIAFAGHTDLRRLLTDYGFVGHPLRKDFPLSGHVQARYDLVQRRVVMEPVKLTQDYRSFDTESPWQGMQKTAPGRQPVSASDTTEEGGAA